MSIAREDVTNYKRYLKEAIAFNEGAVRIARLRVILAEMEARLLVSRPPGSSMSYATEARHVADMIDGGDDNE